MSSIRHHLGARAGVLLAVVLFAGMACTAPNPGSAPGVGGGMPDPAAAGVPVIDTHNHLFGETAGSRGLAVRDFDGAAEAALAAMDRLGIRMLFIMPPPFTASQTHRYDIDELVGVVSRHPRRFAFLGGGGSLNVLLHQAAREGNAGPEVRVQFERTAEEILARGALGFGEMTAEHFSLGGTWHPYESAPPDHVLLRLLADIAARHDVPIDIHMEAIAEEMSLPDRLASPPNPRVLRPNIAAFERLLEHNRKAKIIWAHAGWDNTGQRTAKLSAELLGRHPNLTMSFKIGGDSGRANRPVDRQRGLDPAWLELLRTFPDHFVIGSDQFYTSPRADRRFPGHPEATLGILTWLPPDLARKVGHENAERIFKLRE